MRPICSLFVLAIACNPGTAQEAAPARQQHFSGHALDTRGRPLEGVEVRLLDERAGLVGEVLARTGGDGAFALELPALASESSLDAAWSTSVLLSRRGKATIGIRPFVQWATPLRDANVVMPAGITMRGVVRDPSGAPLEGARIIAKDATSFRRLLLGTEAFGTGDQSPEATCVARSDAAGSFELRGVLPSGTRLLVSHAGHATRATPPVSAGDELAIVLEPTGFARGTLVDADGAPQAGHLILLQESGIFRVTDVGPGGAFEIPLESTGDFALLAMPDSPYSTEEPLLDPGAWRAGPADDLRVVVQSPGRPPADPAEASAGSAVFPIRVIDATTGAPIAGARGAVIWEETILELDLAITQLMGWGLHFEGDATGTIRARGPSGDDDERGLAFAIAPGYAPCRAEAKWDPKGGGLELKMAVGAIVSGHVIDASTGAPVANASVVVQQPGQAVNAIGGLPMGLTVGEHATAPGTAITGADGAFRIDSLPPGSAIVRAQVDGRPNSADIPVDLLGGVMRSNLRLTIPRGATVHGTVRGLTSHDGVRLGLVAEMFQLGAQGALAVFAGQLPSSERAIALGPDGSFAFEGVPPGKWRFRIHVLSPHLGAPPPPVELETLIEVGSEDLRTDLDASSARPGRLGGRVSIDGAEIPAGRTTVIARAALDEDPLMPAFEDSGGVRTTAEPDGSFDFTLPAGRWTLAVVDAVTGIELGRAEPIELGAGARVRRDLEIEVGAVRIRVEPAEGDAFIGRFVEIGEVSTGAPGAPGFAFAGMDVPERGIGVSLEDGTREHVVYLPATPFELRLWAGRRPTLTEFFGWLGTDGARPTLVRPVQAVAGKTTEVELRAPSR